jgi:hypothetical protein
MNRYHSVNLLIDTMYGHQRRINEIPQHARDTLEIKRNPYMIMSV